MHINGKWTKYIYQCIQCIQLLAMGNKRSYSIDPISCDTSWLEEVRQKLTQDNLHGNVIDIVKVIGYNVPLRHWREKNALLLH